MNHFDALMAEKRAQPLAGRPARVTCTANAAAIVKDWRSGAITLVPILAIDFSTPVPQEVNP